MNIAKLSKARYVGTGEGMVPHVGVHSRTVQERSTTVPCSHYTCLQELHTYETLCGMAVTVHARGFKTAITKDYGSEIYYILYKYNSIVHMVESN